MENFYPIVYDYVRFVNYSTNYVVVYNIYSISRIVKSAQGGLWVRLEMTIYLCRPLVENLII